MTRVPFGPWGWLRPPPGPGQLPVAIAVVGLSASLGLYRALQGFERGQLTFIADTEAQRAAGDLQEGMQSAVDTFGRVAQR